jgi:S1-C subfamily serine protease
MYGWVGSIGTGPPSDETPGGKDLTAFQTPLSPQTVPPGRGPQQVNHPQFPVGIGRGQMRLINKPTFPAGIGNGQMRLINQARPGGPFLGLSLVPPGPAVSKELGIKAGKGLYIESVIPDSPAFSAGIKTGDVLLKADRKQVNSLGQMDLILQKKKAGNVLKLLVNRNGRKKSFHVKLANAPRGIQAGLVRKPNWMGADIQDIDTVMKIQFNLPDRKGVIISGVLPDSPAASAGLRTGDVIKSFDNKKFSDVGQLQSLIQKSKPGQRAQLTIYRNGQTIKGDVVLGQRAANRKIPYVVPAEMAIEGSWIGMDVEELTAEDAEELGLPAGTTGILVTDVEGPPATTVGFQSGDTITAVNGTQTPDMKHFGEATKKQAGAVVDVIRGNRHIFISVPPPGYTQQGTKVNTGTAKGMRQVAQTTPMGGRFALFSSGPGLNFSVAGENTPRPYLVMVDQGNSSYTVLQPLDLNQLARIFRRHGITALIGTEVSRQTAASLNNGGVIVFSGVHGPVIEAIKLYEANCLTPLKGI